MSFLGLGFGEILVICVVLLLVVGPNKLPDIARTIGKGFRTIRRTSQELRDSLEVDEIRRALYEDPMRDWPNDKVRLADVEPEQIRSRLASAKPAEPAPEIVAAQDSVPRDPGADTASPSPQDSIETDTPGEQPVDEPKKPT